MSVTKGKWEVVENDYFVDIMCEENAIASVHSNEFNGVSKEQMRANARMMALAPELFERLSKANDEIAFLISIYNNKVKDPANFLDAETCHINQLLLAKVKGDL